MKVAFFLSQHDSLLKLDHGLYNITASPPLYIMLLLSEGKRENLAAALAKDSIRVKKTEL